MVALVATGLIGYAGVTVINGMRGRSRGSQPPGLNPDEVDALRLQIEEAEQIRLRLAELEERLDFTERPLARQQEPPRIGEGGG